MKSIDELLKEVKHIHFIGIGGSGMCPLAEILNKEGYIITGSDNNESDTLKRIRDLGIKVTMGQRAENIEGAEMIVYTAALLSDNPELVAAKASGIPTFERSKLFGAISRMYNDCIGISGTHGKTTTTSMLTQIFIDAHRDPTAVIGGKLPLTGTNGIVGKSDLMVCEACEFVDTFLNLSPAVSVILNIDEDHLDYFKTLENLISSFTDFADLASRAVIYNGDDANTLTAIGNVKKNGNKEFITFGLNEGNDYRAVNVEVKYSLPEYDLEINGKPAGHIQLNVPGKHNVIDSLAAVSAAMHEGVSFEDCAAALKEFRGAGRRFEMLGTYNGVTIADDYAHHPTELEVTLNAAKQMKYNDVWAVFQPFTFSRTAMLMDDFARVLKIADKVVMTEIMGSREVNTYNVYTSQLAEKIPGSVWFNEFEEVAEYVVKNAKPGDLVITLGCGDIYKAAKIMIKKYKTLE
ncbi:MAG: UDP-N-acetylmuramate--L-alanine ligase [Clostridiales bacterium]|nr:UDP-N-acetylmuramate--L-alanine ligase [Clostridiales bacterium]